jgi:hypothetical protein
MPWDPTPRTHRRIAGRRSGTAYKGVGTGGAVASVDLIEGLHSSRPGTRQRVGEAIRGGAGPGVPREPSAIVQHDEDLSIALRRTEVEDSENDAVLELLVADLIEIPAIPVAPADPTPLVGSLSQ